MELWPALLVLWSKPRILHRPKRFDILPRFVWSVLVTPVIIERAMTSPSTRPRVDLVVFGEFFLDLIFYKLPRAPKIGEEVKTAHFEEVPGGGLATTALVAAGLGTPTAVVTRVGKDARRNPAWLRLVRSGIFAGACEFSTKFPTAMTVCAAYDGDRMMITHDAINQRLHTLLMRPDVRRQLHKAK